MPQIYTSGNANPISTTGAATLSSGTVYYVPVGGEVATTESFQLWFDNAIAFTATLEDTNFEPSVVADYANDVKWVPENPSGAVAATTGTPSNATLTVAAGTAGSGMWHIGNSGALRTRWKISVAGTGGQVMVRWFQKVPAL